VSKVLAYGTIKAGGPTVIEWCRGAPSVIDTVKVGDNMRVSLMQDVDGVYVSLNERIPCRSVEHAKLVFQSVVDDGKPVDLSDSPFDHGPVDAHEWPF